MKNGKTIVINMNKKTIITIFFALLIIPMGVEAKNKSKKEEIPQLLNYPSAELSEYRLQCQKGLVPDI